jgi:hypothetical protein
MLKLYTNSYWVRLNLIYGCQLMMVMVVLFIERVRCPTAVDMIGE